MRKESIIEKNQRNFHKRKARNIIVNGAVWKWTISRGGDIKAFSISGLIVSAKAWELKGYSQQGHWFNDCYWKKSTLASITPKDIEKWLLTI